MSLPALQEQTVCDVSVIEKGGHGVHELEPYSVEMVLSPHC